MAGPLDYNVGVWRRSGSRYANTEHPGWVLDVWLPDRAEAGYRWTVTAIGERIVDSGTEATPQEAQTRAEDALARAEARK